MNKSDIQYERMTRAKELLVWAERLDMASPSLARLFRDQASYIGEPSRKYDSWGATIMMGKVDGLILAAHTLLEELARQG